ncbi:MAG: acyl-CoA desaturase [Chitinophagaceae bacterium]|nr:acyl-CoA desaturase [Chitinophagaceae bacterium]
MAVLIFFAVHWYLSLFCQTFFLHRYAAHNAFRMSRGWEKFFYVLTWLTQGSSYMSARTYALLHRLHHAYTDTEDDPHSPKYSSNAITLMNDTRKRYADIFNGKIVVEEKFLKNLPDWPAFEKFAHPWFMRVIWIGIYTAFYYYFVTAPWQWLLLPFTIMIGPIHGGIINWFAHKYGSVNFEMNNTSKNLFYIDVLMLGEAYHNNHHKFPSSINFGVKKNEIDPIYFAILLFNKLGIIRLNKVERKVIEHEKSTVYLNERRMRKIS